MLFHFAEIAEKYPDRQALFFQSNKESMEWTYQELDEYTTQLAKYLYNLGVKEGMHLGVYCYRSPFYPLLFLACAKLGAVYVPLVHTLSPEKLNQMISHADIQFIFTEEALDQNIKILAKDHIYFINKIDFSQSQNIIFNKPRSEENPTLYIIFSSGTTNAPKGIPIAHDGLRFWGEWLRKEISDGNPPCVLGNTSVGFDPHIWEYVMAWSTGGCLYFTNHLLHQSPPDLQKYFLTHHISDATFTPKLFELFSSIQRGKLLPKLQKSGLRRCYLTGEALSKNILSKCDRANIKVYNCYGPSELTFGFSVKAVRPENINRQGEVEIGFSPSANIRAFLRQASEKESKEPDAILDLNETKTGRGELLVSSPYMTKAYYRNPELSHKKFSRIIKDGISYSVYATEDILEINQGKLYFKGRSGDLVKRDLIFINLEDIRKLIANFYADQSVLYDVILLNKPEKDYLFVFIANQKRKTRTEDLKQFILDSLSKNEVPNHIISLDKFPYTENGKSDKIKLKALAEAHLLQEPSEEKLLSAQFQADQDLTKLEPQIQQAFWMLLEEVIPNARSIVQDKNILVTSVITQSIDWVRFVNSLRIYFNLDLSFYQMKSLSFRQMLFTILRPYLQLGVLEYSYEKSGGTKPLFFLPPVTGECRSYVEIVGHHTEAVYMHHPLSSPKIYSNQDLNKLCHEAYSNITIKEQAKAHADCMRQVQNEGSYQIAGWSFAGISALCLLVELEIEHLMLMDAPDPKYLMNLTNQELELWLKQFAEFIFQQFKLEKGVYLALPDEIAYQTDKDEPKAIIHDFFQYLKSLIIDWDPLKISKLNNMLSVAKMNMLSVYQLQLEDHGLKAKSLSLWQSETGLMGQTICLPERWKLYSEIFETQTIPKTDHFSMMKNPILKMKVNQSSKASTSPSKEEKFSSENPYLLFNSMKDLQPLGSIKIHKNLPIENSYYQNRMDLTAFIDEKLKTKNMAICYGPQGMGKTELAKHYIHSHLEQYPICLWMNAVNTSTLFDYYYALALELRSDPRFLKFFDMSTDELHGKAVEKVKDFLQIMGNWLIVYDDAESYDKIKDYLPTRGGKIVITSYRNTWPTPCVVPVDVMKIDECKGFIKTVIGSEVKEEDTNNLLQEFHRFPLALAQASAYIFNKGISVNAYLKDYKENKKLKLLEDSSLPLGTKHKPIITTWHMTLKAIQEESIHAYRLINCIAYLYLDCAPREAFLIILKEFNSEANMDDLDTAISCLLKYFVISYNRSKDHYNIHPFLQKIILFVQENPQDWLTHSLIIANRDTESNIVIGGNFTEDSEYLEKIMKSYKEILDKNNHWAIHLSLACCYLVKKDFDHAKNYLDESIRLNANTRNLCELGNAYYVHGDFDHAIDTMLKVIESGSKEKIANCNYFSDMEKDCVDPDLHELIKKLGVLRVESVHMAYYIICRSYQDKHEEVNYQSFMHQFSKRLGSVNSILFDTLKNKYGLDGKLDLDKKTNQMTLAH